MPLDPSIALQFRLPQVDNPLQTYSQAQTLRGQMLQNEALERAAADAPRLREMEMMKRQGDLQQQQTGIEKNKAETAIKKLELVRERLTPVSNQEQWNQWIAESEQVFPGVSAKIPPTFSEEEKVKQLMQSKDAIAQISTTAGQQLTAETSRRGQDIDLEVAGMVDARQREANQIADATRRYTAGLPVTPVTIADPKDPSATVVIDARTRQVIGKGPKPTETGKADQRRARELPQAKMRMESMTQNLDRLESAMTELHSDPGLWNITGTVFGRTPNITNTATGAQAQLNSVKAQIFVSALQAMREASKTGGAVGNVSDREGDKLENTMAALDQAQSTDSFKKQLRKAIDQLRRSKVLIQSAFDEQYADVADVRALKVETVPEGQPLFDEADAILNRGK